MADRSGAGSVTWGRTEEDVALLDGSLMYSIFSDVFLALGLK
jgi:hypothetical protein